jgi:hypothetical protein
MHGGTLRHKIFVSIIVILSIIATTAADARPKHGRHKRPTLIVCDDRGCSDRVSVNRRVSQTVVDANGNVVGGRPAGCPHAFCGCEASLYVFGEKRRDLFLASNWIRKFPRTAPAPGMVAARNHHVMVLISHVSGRDWMVHDGNSGGGLTRDHVVSISGYVIVDPHGLRSAER